MLPSGLRWPSKAARIASRTLNVGSWRKCSVANRRCDSRYTIARVDATSNTSGLSAVMLMEDCPQSVKDAVAHSVVGPDARMGGNAHDAHLNHADDALWRGWERRCRASWLNVNHVRPHRRSAADARLRRLCWVARMRDDSLIARLRAPDAIRERAIGGEKCE